MQMDDQKHNKQPSENFQYLEHANNVQHIITCVHEPIILYHN